MQGLLEGRTGIVTGAAGGIGRASALAFARQGARVVVVDLPTREDDGRETVRLIEAEGGHAAFFAADVSREADHEALVGWTVERHGRLDFAHNNAGIVIEGRITEIEEADFDRVIAVNLKGVLLGMKHQLRALLRNDGPSRGAILNTASLAGLISAPSAGSYVASKHAIVGLTKTAAVECADQGIRVNAICPAAVRTPMMEAQPADRVELLIAPQAMKRFAEPSEVAAVAVWLCSDEASFITGLAMPVDAGALAF